MHQAPVPVLEVQYHRRATTKGVDDVVGMSAPAPAEVGVEVEVEVEVEVSVEVPRMVSSSKAQAFLFLCRWKFPNIFSLFFARLQTKFHVRFCYSLLLLLFFKCAGQAQGVPSSFHPPFRFGEKEIRLWMQKADTLA
jgi:hypothetical protein